MNASSLRPTTPRFTWAGLFLLGLSFLTTCGQLSNIVLRIDRLQHQRDSFVLKEEALERFRDGSSLFNSDSPFQRTNDLLRQHRDTMKALDSHRNAPFGLGEQFLQLVRDSRLAEARSLCAGELAQEDVWNANLERLNSVKGKLNLAYTSLINLDGSMSAELTYELPAKENLILKLDRAGENWRIFSIDRK